MPELPEVETIRRGLERHLVGRRIERVLVRDSRLRIPVDEVELDRWLPGRRIAALGRRAKYLLVHLEDDRILVVHLGMTGRLWIEDPATPILPHTHVILDLEGYRQLRFHDTRRFGMFFVLSAAELPQHPRFAHLGPEPLEDGFDLAYLRRRALQARKPIKNLLMDANVVVGVGNIYATEALYAAGVHPRTPAARLGAERLARVRRAVRQLLRRAVHVGGTTLRDYRDAEGRSGSFQTRLRVYGMQGRACGQCGRKIRRIVQSGRSTFYCPGCQH